MLEAPESHIQSAWFESGAAGIRAEIPGVVQRRVDLTKNGLTVTDTPLRAGAAMTVNWLLVPDAEVAASFKGGTSLISTDAQYAPHYGRLARAIRYDVTLESIAESVISLFSAETDS